MDQKGQEDHLHMVPGLVQAVEGVLLNSTRHIPHLIFQSDGMHRNKYVGDYTLAMLIKKHGFKLQSNAHPSIVYDLRTMKVYV